MSWSRRFEEAIELPDGRKLKTLAEAMAWLAKEIPKSEHKMGEGADGCPTAKRIRVKRGILAVSSCISRGAR